MIASIRDQVSSVLPKISFGEAWSQGLTPSERRVAMVIIATAAATLAMSLFLLMGKMGAMAWTVSAIVPLGAIFGVLIPSWLTAVIPPITLWVLQDQRRLEYPSFLAVDPRTTGSCGTVSVKVEEDKNNEQRIFFAKPDATSPKTPFDPTTTYALFIYDKTLRCFQRVNAEWTPQTDGIQETKELTCQIKDGAIGYQTADKNFHALTIKKIII